jgi:hypothetical protein
MPPVSRAWVKGVNKVPGMLMRRAGVPGPHGAVWVRRIREVDVSHGHIALSVLSCLVNTTVQPVPSKYRMWGAYGSWVEALCRIAKAWWLLPIMNTRAVRINRV